VLEPLVQREPGNAAAAFQLGVAYEDLGRFADARRLYGTYLERSSSPELRRQVQGRLALLGRLELQAAVQGALAREQQLAGVQPEVRTVGVFPFLTVTDTALRPLGRALSELLTTDLSQTDRLRVVERAQLQHLLNEIQLAETGATDPATAARAGRLIGAGQIVQGRVEGSQDALRVQALVVPVGTALDTTRTPYAQQGSIQRLFDMQTALALELYRRLGVELTVAERERVTQRPTENVQALLAFGFGLESEDGSQWSDAVAHFRRAVDLDPNFNEARQHLAFAESMAEAAETTPEELSLAAALEWDDLAEWLRRRERFFGVDGLVPSPEGRDATAEILRLEGLERAILIDLIIRRPGGGQ
jgi:tetratricopeptide (TPR) repeat protein